MKTKRWKRRNRHKNPDLVAIHQICDWTSEILGKQYYPVMGKRWFYIITPNTTPQHHQR